MLVFETRASGRIQSAKSASRRNTIGHAIDTIIAHVTSGHCQRRGNDQSSAPGPDSATPSSGSSQIVSRLKFSPSLTTSRIAGVRYIAAINDRQRHAAQPRTRREQQPESRQRDEEDSRRVWRRQVALDERRRDRRDDDEEPREARRRHRSGPRSNVITVSM